MSGTNHHATSHLHYPLWVFFSCLKTPFFNCSVHDYLYCLQNDFYSDTLHTLITYFTYLTAVMLHGEQTTKGSASSRKSRTWKTLKQIVAAERSVQWTADTALCKRLDWHLMSTDVLFSCVVLWLQIVCVGGVAQWLGRRKLAGALSLIYFWSMVDMWLLHE